MDERASARSSRQAMFKDFYQKTSPVPPPKMAAESCSPGRRVLLFPQRRRKISPKTPKTPLRQSELTPDRSNEKQSKWKSPLTLTSTLPEKLHRFQIRVTDFPPVETNRDAGRITQVEMKVKARVEEDDDLFIVSMPRGRLRRFTMRPSCFPGDPFVRGLRPFRVDVKSFPVAIRIAPLKRFRFRVDVFPLDDGPALSRESAAESGTSTNKVEEEQEEVDGLDLGNVTKDTRGSEAVSQQGCFLNTEDVLQALDQKETSTYASRLRSFAIHPTSFPVAPSLTRFRVDPRAFPAPVEHPQLRRFQVDPEDFPPAPEQKLKSFSVPPWQFPVRLTGAKALRPFAVATDVFPVHDWQHIKGLKTRWRALLKPGEDKEEAVGFGSRVTVHMKGSTLGGKNVFWNTKDVGESAYSFNAGVGKIVKGLDAAIIGMKVGEVRHVNGKSIFCSSHSLCTFQLLWLTSEIVASTEGYGKAGFPQWGIRANEVSNIQIKPFPIQLTFLRSHSNTIRTWISKSNSLASVNFLRSFTNSC